MMPRRKQSTDVSESHSDVDVETTSSSDDESTVNNRKRRTRSSISESTNLTPVKKRQKRQLSAHCEMRSSPRHQANCRSPNYSDGVTMCPTPGCDSKGHLCGKFDSHRTISGCPMYHNTTAQECRQWYRDKEKHSITRKNILASVDNRHTLRKQSPTREQKHIYREIRTARKSVDFTDENRIAWIEHSKEFGKTRQPLLKGLASDFDVNLFCLAQAKACENLTYEMHEHNQLIGNGEYSISKIEIGRFELETWYSSPFPEEYARLPKLYLCEFCLKYMKTSTILRRHTAKCVWRHPPGDEIYRKANISVFEVDGKKNKVYCQHLCLLAKLFLDHKTLYFDVEPFLFYVMTEADSQGCHIIGYFSKEKNSLLNYNVSCILTLPQYMRQGFGKMLIDFSYLLSKVEEKIGSPERPLSDLGLISYRSYWKDELLSYIHNYKEREICIKDLSHESKIRADDIVSTLQALGMLRYWKGKHLVLKKQDILVEYLDKKKSRRPDNRKIDPSCLKWTPVKH